MATMTLVPETVGTNQWGILAGETDYVDVVDDANHSTYIFENNVNQTISYLMTNPSVSEANIDFNEDITVTPRIYAYYTNSTGYVTLEVNLDGGDIVYTANSLNIDDTGAGTGYAYTSADEMDSGTPWTYAGLEALRIHLKTTTRPNRYEAIRVSYIEIIVEYTEAAVVTENATFFGANF